MPHKLEKIWDALPPEYHKEGAHPADMAIAYIEHQKSALGRLTRAFTGAGETMSKMGKNSQAEEAAQSIKELWLQKEELEKKLLVLNLEKTDADATILKLQKQNAENSKRIKLYRQFATTVRSLTGHSVPVAALVDIAEDVLSKTE